MINGKIDVTKIDKGALFHGQKGKYLNITLLENRDGTDQYGNDGMIVQDIGQERRQAGERGAILGNYKIRRAPKPDHQQPSYPDNQPSGNEDDIPF